MPERDRDGAHDRHVRQQADEPRRGCEIALAVLVTQMDVFRRLLDTVDINTVQFLWAVVPAVGLLLLWELGKLIARRRGSGPRLKPRTSMRYRAATRREVQDGKSTRSDEKEASTRVTMPPSSPRACRAASAEPTAAG